MLGYALAECAIHISRRNVPHLDGFKIPGNSILSVETAVKNRIQGNVTARPSALASRIRFSAELSECVRFSRLEGAFCHDELPRSIVIKSFSISAKKLRRGGARHRFQ